MFKAPLTTVTHLHEKGQENAKKLCATRMALHRTVKLYQEISINEISEDELQVERCFINPRGLPNSPQSRHVLFSISKNDSYSGAVMAGIYEKRWWLGLWLPQTWVIKPLFNR
uniref:TFR_dimer domain-containing protein n=1 Tax=Heterorhabditis bacteriophora TaxID=37862 RepID=A0A1I7X2X3_HETBA